MSKQVNENIGTIDCPLCAAVAAVRRDKNKKLYYDCLNCGRSTPNLPGGQDVILQRAKLWGAGGPPADCPRWIAEQWPWGRAMRHADAMKPREPESVNEESPGESPKKPPGPASVNDDLPEPPPPRNRPGAKPVNAPEPEHELAAAGGGSIWSADSGW